jgi:toxin YoeB
VVVVGQFAAVGMLEPLTHELAGCWSRCITQEHRLIYRVIADRIEYVKARYHNE